MESKFEIFLEIAKTLNERFHVTPVLYGSLGLSRLLNQDILVNDIDMLVPDEFIEERWEELKQTIERLGYTLQDLHEHEFVRNGQIIAFARYSDLGDIEATVDDLHHTEEAGVSFYELTLDQYLAVYRYCLNDGYRQAKKVDKEKIALIEQALEEKHRT